MRISDWSSDVCSSDLDRRGADRAAVLLQIGDDRADDPRIVDAAMLKEGAVIRREESAHEQRRIFAVVVLDAAFAGIAVDRLALAIPHAGGERRFIVEKLVEARQDVWWGKRVEVRLA